MSGIKNKNIFILAPDENECPPELLQNMDSIKELNPEWEMRIFRENTAIDLINDSGFFDVKWNKKYGAMMGDLFRYVAVFLYGGVYLDVKSTTTVKFDFLSDYVHKNCVLCRWPPMVKRGEMVQVGTEKVTSVVDKGEILQWFFYSNKRSQFLKIVIDKVAENLKKYDQNVDGVGKLAVINVTGPTPFTEAAVFCNMYDSSHIFKKFGLKYTIYSTMNGHFGKYGNPHYSEISEPLVLGDSA